jgi:WD40 repeat protein/DNA-binding SARP family transcriptional activator
MLEIRLLGQFEVRLDGEPVTLALRSAQSLLAYLVLSAGTAHRREKLAGLQWPDADEDSARGSLRHALWRIRKAIELGLPTGERYLLTDDLSIAFNATVAYTVDATALDGATNSACTLDDLKDALSHYRGELLPGFYEEWVLRERERLEAVFDRKMDELLERLVVDERWPDVLEWAERWIAVGHTPEPAYRALMLAHSERGDRARVATVYQRCRQALFEELGAQPSERTRTLFERLSRGERVLPTRAMPARDGASDARTLDQDSAAPGEPPYKGLQYFDEADAEWYFGRESLVARLVERLQTEPLLALVGASGSGKSSVVRAGLVPALRQTSPPGGSTWCVHVLTPSAHPLEALVTTLTRSVTEPASSMLDYLTQDPRALRLHLHQALETRTRALLVVDQFEELFTLCHDPFEREAFVDNLLAAAEPRGAATVVLALRADFYAHCAQYPDLRVALAEHQEYLGPMVPEELRRAIEGPAARGDWVFEPALVDLLMRDVGDEPGALPLLSHALLETWHRRRQRRLTLAGYADAGRVQGAIARTAETVFRERLPAAHQAIARRIFLYLTELGEGTQDTRRRARVSELVLAPNEEAVVQAVIQELARARLITLGEQTAEVAHEALIREWPTLRAWLDDDRASLRLHRQLTQAAQEWDRMGGDAGALYRGVRLTQARDWAAQFADELNPLERAFLQLSEEATERDAVELEAARQRELDAARTIAETERRAAAQLRQRALFLAAAFSLAMAMAGLALFFGDQAHQTALVAQANARTAYSRELAAAAIANLNVDPELSVLLGIQAVRITYDVDGTWSADAESALHRALLASRVQFTLDVHAGALVSAAFSPDGSEIATAGADGSVRVWDARNGRELLVLHGHSGQVNRAVFSPDGQRIATASLDRTAKVWEAATGQEQLTLVGHTDRVDSIAWSPDGQRLATASRDGTGRVWDASSGTPLATLTGHQDAVHGIAFNPDGSHVVTSSDDRTARVWDAYTGEQELTLRGHSGGIGAVAYSRDGTRIATASGASTDNTARLWDAKSGQQLLSLSGHTNTVGDVAFSRDGARLTTAGYDGTAKVWDVSSGAQLFTLFGHSGFVLSVAFSPDGQRLVTSSLDGTARVWDAGPSKELLAFSGHTARPWKVAFSPDGTRVVSASLDGTARVWDPTTGQELLTLAGHTDRVHGVAFSPDGRRVVTASGDNTARVWDAVTGREQLTLAGHGEGLVGGLFHGVVAAAFTPDGTQIATAGADKLIIVWDATTGEALRAFAGHTAGLTALSFSPDGRLLASGGDDNTARVWDFATGHELHTLRGHTVRVWGLGFSPDGSRLATASADSTIRIWDVANGGELLVLQGHTGTVNTAVFTPDGARLVTAGRDATIKVWDAATGHVLLTLSGEVPGYTGMALSPDGTRVAAVADDAVRLYVLPIQDLMALARMRVTRSWTAKECAEFLHVAECPAPSLTN